MKYKGNGNKKWLVFDHALWVTSGTYRNVKCDLRFNDEILFTIFYQFKLDFRARMYQYTGILALIQHKIIEGRKSVITFEIWKCYVPLFIQLVACINGLAIKMGNYRSRSFRFNSCVGYNFFFLLGEDIYKVTYKRFINLFLFISRCHLESTQF